MYKFREDCISFLLKSQHWDIFVISCLEEKKYKGVPDYKEIKNVTKK